jgi:carbonic anhydrase
MFLVSIRASIVDDGGGVTPRWGYDDDDGPDTWFGDCRTGIRQSPIDIDFRLVQIDNQLPKIYFMNYDQSGNVKFDNNGHTGELIIDRTIFLIIDYLKSIIINIFITIFLFHK